MKVRVYVATIIYHLQSDTIAEDELQNVEMAEDEKTQKNKELKIKKADYTGYDDDEFLPENQGMKRAVLSKYDEFLEGPKEIVGTSVFRFVLVLMIVQGFRLGGSTTTIKKATLADASESSSVSVKKALLSIDYDSQCDPLVVTRLLIFPHREFGDG